MNKHQVERLLEYLGNIRPGDVKGVIDKLVALRVIDSEMFMGSKIQEEIDTGFLVTNADCVLVKSHA